MILDSITKAPMYVWPLLVYLIIIGIKSSKPHTMSIKRLFAIPLIFFVWAVYSLFMRTDIYQMLTLTAGIIIGTRIGFLLVRSLPIRFDKINSLVEMPGSWLTFILAMTIFSLKFFIGAIQTTYPELKGTWLLLIPEFGAMIVSGIFAGRGIGYWLKYRSAPEVDTN